MESQIIPGIHNYCDRWCERCRMVHRCRLGLQEFNEMMSNDYKEITLEDALERVRQSFEMMGEMLKEAEQRFDIDLDDLEEIEEVEPDEKGQELLNWTREFMKQTHDFISNSHFSTAETVYFPGEDLAEFIELSQDPVGEHYDILSYYHTMVGSKSHRAVHGLFNDILEEEDDIQTDYNGSAKVALMCCKACRSALKGIYGNVDKEEAILNLLKLIQKIIDRLEDMFPHAYDFVRPGFDE